MNDAELIAKLQAALDDAVNSGEECGCQLTIYRHGKLLCDLCAGWPDVTKQKKVKLDTMFPVFSVGKGVMSTLFHIYAQEGAMSYDDPVIKYWPEYGACGKEKTLISDVLSHRAGKWDYPEGTQFKDWTDWPKNAEILASSPALSPIGGKHQYHAFTYGVLTGYLLERITGRKLKDMLEEKILKPLGIHTFFYGLPDSISLDDVAKIVPGDCFGAQFNADFVLRGINPSHNACANAHALARIYASLIENGVDGVKLLKDETLQNALILRRNDDDPVTSPEWEWDRFGLGYALRGPEAPWNQAFGHGGMVGSEGFADFKTGYAIGFTKNKSIPEHPNHKIRNTISHILGIPERFW